jgi:hypothetical protein
LIVLVSLFVYEFYLQATESVVQRAHRQWIVLQSNESLIQSDSVLGYTFRPNLKIPFSQLEFSTTIETDSLGFRRSRVTDSACFFGDSFTMGWGVEGDETFASLYGARNYGVSGYNTIQEIALWQRLGKPRHGYVFFNYTDLLENTIAMRWGNTWLFNHMPLSYQKLVIWIQGRQTLKGEELWQKFLDALKPAVGSDLTVVYIPMRGEFGKKPAYPPSRTVPGLKSIRWLDVTPYLDARCYYYLDGHLNREGHARVAWLLEQAERQEVQP